MNVKQTSPWLSLLVLGGTNAKSPPEKAGSLHEDEKHSCRSSSSSSGSCRAALSTRGYNTTPVAHKRVRPSPSWRQHGLPQQSVRTTRGTCGMRTGSRWALVAVSAPLVMSSAYCPEYVLPQ